MRDTPEGGRIDGQACLRRYADIRRETDSEQPCCELPGTVNGFHVRQMQNQAAVQTACWHAGLHRHLEGKEWKMKTEQEKKEERYLISETAKLVGVESHVLRYWEEELKLPIRRNELGHRYLSLIHI